MVMLIKRSICLSVFHGPKKISVTGLMWFVFEELALLEASIAFVGFFMTLSHFEARSGISLSL